LGQGWPDSRDHPGVLDGTRADPRLDEPRGPDAHGGQGRGGVLVALAQEALAQGRGIGPHAEGARTASGLCFRCDPAPGGPGGRHRLPHRARELFFPQTRKREMGDDGPGAQGSGGHLQKMSDILERLARTIEERKGADTDKSYVARLLAAEEDALLKKIGEEATETVLAAKGGDRLHLVRETADLWFHCMILLARHGLKPA